MRLIQLDKIGQLREFTAKWDALWSASDVVAPTARAALVQAWIECFSPRERFRCLLIEHEGSLLAALPLVETRVRVVPAGGVVANCWSAAGQLLVDSQASETVLDLLVQGFEQLPWPLLWLEGINPTLESWQRLLAACDRAGVRHEFRHDRQVGLIDITHDWPAYEATWTRNHARNLSKSWRRVEQSGKVAIDVRSIHNADEAEHLLGQAAEIEGRSWKANVGTSLTCNPSVHAFFVRQARQLATWEALDFCFLSIDDRPIAFEFGYRAKGVHLAHKTGYDEAFATFSPGQLVMRELLRSLHADPEIGLVDCLGPMSDAVARWTARTYPEGRMLLAPRTRMGQSLWWTYRTARRVQRLRTSFST